jgi:predicted metal-dependent hydrolase
MVPVAIIFGRVARSHDDAVMVDTTDVMISTPSGAPDEQLRQALYSALKIMEAP